MRTNHAPFALALLLLVIVLSLAGNSSQAAFAQSSASAQNIQTGITEGVLVAKGDAWIAVRADGEREAVRLIPRWIGGLPKNGGGLDKRMLLLFRELRIGMRLKVAWLQEEHLRVIDLQILPQRQEGADDKNSVASRSGTALGVVTNNRANASGRSDAG